MDQGRDVDADRLRHDMETTRGSISATINELRDKVSDAMNWRAYVERYPATTLAGAVALGLMVGRQVGTRIVPDGGQRAVSNSYSEGGEIGHDVRGVLPAGPERAGSGHSLLASLGTSWARAGSRLESLVNRLIDDLAETAEQHLVPVLVSSVQDFFPRRQELETAHGPRARHAAGEPAPADPAEYPGGPTGHQAYSHPIHGPGR